MLAEKNSDGSWSDYIFSNGQRIAQADSYDERIHMEGTSTVAGAYAAWYVPFPSYTIKAGDKLSWRQYQAGGGKGGVVVSFTDGNTANWGTYDQEQAGHQQRVHARGMDGADGGPERVCGQDDQHPWGGAECADGGMHLGRILFRHGHYRDGRNGDADLRPGGSDLAAVFQLRRRGPGFDLSSDWATRPPSLIVKKMKIMDACLVRPIMNDE